MVIPAAAAGVAAAVLGGGGAVVVVALGAVVVVALGSVVVVALGSVVVVALGSVVVVALGAVVVVAAGAEVVVGGSPGLCLCHLGRPVGAVVVVNPGAEVVVAAAGAAVRPGAGSVAEVTGEVEVVAAGTVDEGLCPPTGNCWPAPSGAVVAATEVWVVDVGELVVVAALGAPPATLTVTEMAVVAVCFGPLMLRVWLWPCLAAGTGLEVLEPLVGWLAAKDEPRVSAFPLFTAVSPDLEPVPRPFVPLPSSFTSPRPARCTSRLLEKPPRPPWVATRSALLMTPGAAGPASRPYLSPLRRPLPRLLVRPRLSEPLPAGGNDRSEALSPVTCGAHDKAPPPGTGPAPLPDVAPIATAWSWTCVLVAPVGISSNKARTAAATPALDTAKCSGLRLRLIRREVAEVGAERTDNGAGALSAEPVPLRTGADLPRAAADAPPEAAGTMAGVTAERWRSGTSWRRRSQTSSDLGRSTGSTRVISLNSSRHGWGTSAESTGPPCRRAAITSDGVPSKGRFPVRHSMSTKPNE